MKELVLTPADKVCLWGFSGGPQIWVRLRPDGKGRKYVSVFNHRGHGIAGVHLIIRRSKKQERRGLGFYARTIGQGLDMIAEYMGAKALV